MTTLRAFLATMVLPFMVGASAVSHADDRFGANLSKAVGQLERDGKLPALDRSADIKGPDQDANGIRDDIDLFIDSKQLDTVKTAARRQMARALQTTLLVELRDTAAFKAVGDQADRAVACVMKRLGADAGYHLVGQIQSYTVNTKPRLQAYNAYHQASSGGVYRLRTTNACD